MPPDRKTLREIARLLAPPLLLALVAGGLWLHRMELVEYERVPNGVHLDAYLYYYPTFAFMHDELAAGRLPLWNPYQMAGQSTLGLHAPAVLYLPNLLLLGALPTDLALRAHAVIHLFLAGLFAWLFAGRLGLGQPARLIAGVVFMLSDNCMLGLYMPSYLSSSIWLPAALWSVHGLASDGRPRFALALGVILALSFMGGHAQGFVYLVQFAALYGVFALVFVAPSGLRLRAVGLAIVGGALAFALASPQLLPAWELARESVRGLDGLSYPAASWSTIGPRMLPWGWLGSLTPRPVDPAALQPVLFVPLLLCAVASRRHRAHAVFFLLAAVVVGLFMTGRGSIVHRLYFELPMGNVFRLPTRASFLYALCGAVLCSFGTNALLGWLRERRAPRGIVVAVGVLLVLGVTADLYAAAKLPNPHPAVHPRLPALPEDLMAFAAERDDRSRFFLERGRFFEPVARRKGGSIHRVPMIADYEPNMSGDYARFLGLDEDLLWHGHLRATEAGKIGPINVSIERLDLMSTRYYFALHPMAPRDMRSVQQQLRGRVRRRGSVWIFDRPGALPRVHVADAVRRVETMEAALAALDEEDFDPRRETVVIGGPQPGEDEARRAGTASITVDSPQRVVIEARCERRCLVLLTDLYDRGWSLRVDGERRESLRANAIFRGAWLTPGAHRLEYRYEPASLRAGWLLAGGGVLASATTASYLGLRRRRAP